MPKLSELTDYQPEVVTPQGRLYVSPNMPTSEDGDYFTKPVAPVPELPSDNIVERIIKKLAETEVSSGSKIGNKLFGTGGEERYQLWPEKVVRSALTAIPDAYSGKIPMHDVDPDTGELVPSQAMIGRAMDMSSFAGVGGVGGTGADAGVALGAGPSLRPALKYKDRLYKGKEGQQHMDVIPPQLYPEFQKMAMSGEDISHYNFGFVNDKGHFLNREDALKYGIDSGLIDPQAGKFGALTSTLMADSSKPGMAIEAVAKTAQPFYSALEHNVSQINQGKMNGEAWLGTLSNKPGVKPEELDWTGLKSFLEENKGKPVTKQQVQNYLAENNTQLNEVWKGKPALFNAEKAFDAATVDGIPWGKGKLYSDEVKRALLNEDLTPADLPVNLRELANNLIQANKESVPTKYHSYQLPGGENYREMLMTLPEKNIGNKTVMTDLGEMPNFDFPLPYKSSHWDEPNILAHVRMNDRTVNGKKSLHLEEIQSDWHQQGRDKGYKSEGDLNKFNELDKAAELARTELSFEAERTAKEAIGSSYGKFLQSNPSQSDRLAAQAKIAEVRKNDKAYQAASDKVQQVTRERDSYNPVSKVPDAPFKKTWHELALKRALREAAEKGYDRLSWTPGEAQAARYDLSKQIDQIKYIKNSDGTYNVVPFKNNSPMHAVERENVKPEELSNIVGKEVAQKITKGEGKKEGDIGVLEGLDLKVGGEGMKGFYDQIIPKAISKLSGEKVKKGEVSANVEGSLPAGATGRKLPVYYIDIPQSLKDKAMQKGFPLFSTAMPGYMFKPVSGNPFEDQ